ncbi:tellurite resistance protein TerA [Paenibacillus cellulosilyticus]|uniref:Tellurite resistance protein TerA n=1 Tax=Paenibacillus cellulosilyticus TaxID=375489 RepID=A0A2V2YPH3_9BACL|nr:TerD family protein [Paenibacillus cellulosilyticus]PWV97887.1 tellurite resistance protein TerA [Paenibacillus cellulosilyticus]QKS46942.1 TerD family protein [Paenibacillus cellulosilyticus]
MSVSVVKGQKADITKGNPSLSNLKVTIGWASSANIELDCSAFLLASSGKVSGDSDLIFYGNPSNAFIAYSEVGATERQLMISLDKVSPQVDKIAFTLTIYEGEQRRQNFSQVNGAFIRFSNAASGQEVLRYDLGNPFSIETAIVVGELYRYNGEWKFSSIGAGYSGGLNALCASYGIETQDKAPVPPVNAQQSPPPAPPKPAAPPVIPPQPQQQQQPVQLNLSKIELKKKGEKINLQKKSGGLGEILINLNWNQQTKKSGFWGSKSEAIDLDLACLYELKNGEKGVIQALGERFGSLDRAPYIVLDGDDRTGSVKTGENIRINGAKVAEIKRILVFTFIYEGVSRWSEADGIVTLKQDGGPDIIVRLDEYDNNHRMCAIAMIENQGNETFSIERIVRHFSGHRELDQAYGWGMRWVAGSK